MKELTITVPDDPEGYKIVDCRAPKKGERLLDDHGCPAQAKFNWIPELPRYILQRVRTDTERLEAMIEHGWAFHKYPNEFPRSIVNASGRIITDPHDDPRAAIDEAMEREQK
jgi:hypothetical protein